MSVNLKRPKAKETDISRAIRMALIAQRLGIFVDVGQARTDAAKAALIRGAIQLAKDRHRPVWIFWRQNTGAGEIKAAGGAGRFVRFSLPGSADYTGIFYPTGRRVDLEIKRPDGRPSPMQLALREVVEGAGGLYLFARSPAEAVDSLGFHLGFSVPEMKRLGNPGT